MADIITSDFGNTLERIRDTEDLSEALAMLKRVKLLKDALEAADRFKELSTKYAVLNAEALLRVIDLGGTSKLRGNARYTAEWLATLSAEERNKFIEMCSDGVTIEHVWKTMIRDPQKRKDDIEYAKFLVDSAVKEVEENGVFDTTDTIQQIRKRLKDNSLTNDLAMGLRNKMLRAGAIGVGLNTGVYIKPLAENNREYSNKDRDNIVSAIYNRYTSICGDLRKMHRIIQESNIKLQYSDVLARGVWKDSDYMIRHDKLDIYELSLLFTMADVGILDKESLDYIIEDTAKGKYQRANWSMDGFPGAREFQLQRANANTSHIMDNIRRNESAKMQKG